MDKDCGILNIFQRQKASVPVSINCQWIKRKKIRGQRTDGVTELSKQRSRQTWTIDPILSVPASRKAMLEKIDN